MKGAVVLAVGLASPAGAFEDCVAEAMAAFEARLSAALNTQAAPNFDLIQGQDVADCGGIALLQCGADAECNAGVAARMAEQADRFAAVPEPDAVAGRNPPWSDGLYPQLWADISQGCGACTAEGTLNYLWAAASLWQVARVVGVVEAEAWR